MAEFKRTPYNACFVSEVLASAHEMEKKNKEDNFEPVRYLSPLGVPMSKVLVVGTALEKEDVGNEQQFWRLRVADQTGGIMVYAGQYQPEAAQVIAGMDTPAYVAVTGKISKYSPDENTTYISIRADRVTLVDEATRNNFIKEAARVTLRRYTADPEMLGAAKETYPGFDHKAFFRQVAEQVNSLLPEDTRVKMPEPEAPAPQQEEEPPAKPEDSNTPPKNAELVYTTIGEIGNGQPVTISQIQGALKEKGYSMINVPAMLEELKNEGFIIETPRGFQVI